MIHVISMLLKNLTESDSNGSHQVGQLALSAAKKFADEVDSWVQQSSVHLPAPHVGPSSHGCVAIEWSKSPTGKELYIFFDSSCDDSLYITLLAANDERGYEEEFFSIQPSSLLNWVKWLVNEDEPTKTHDGTESVNINCTNI